MNKIIIPYIGKYDIPVKFFLNNSLSNINIINTPKISNNTIELGNKYSPTTMCMPFKYTLGTMIEGLNLGGNYIIQLGGGCRYGYYYELQNKILYDLGYKFKMINLVTCGKANIIFIYKQLSSNFKTNIFKMLYYLYLTKNIINYMDYLDINIRNNNINNINKYSQKKLNEIIKIKNPIKQHLFIKKSKLYLDNVKKNPKKYKILLIGELYTLMEPFSNMNIEDKILKYNASITRITNASFLLFYKKKLVKDMLKHSKIIKYEMGADSSNNLYLVENITKEDYDGIIHIKSSFCTPEIAIMPILSKISKKKNVPILYLSFDCNQAATALETRLEAFMDVIEMRKKNE